MENTFADDADDWPLIEDDGVSPDLGDRVDYAPAAVKEERKKRHAL